LQRFDVADFQECQFTYNKLTGKFTYNKLTGKVSSRCNCCKESNFIFKLIAKHR
ncbi:hypothetical protein L9F63_016830, partial [Diploptera punctata]